MGKPSGSGNKSNSAFKRPISEIHYLDSLDLGKDSPPGHIVPRFAAYTTAWSRRSLTGYNFEKSLPFPTYGKLKIRSPHSIRYVTIECEHASIRTLLLAECTMT
ncbi:hypothetical protein ZWY2020_037577 [Hordeum vulgare]|nr:hypothetical protein ZWY2020_037577 [Hordeum vulgare]